MNDYMIMVAAAASVGIYALLRMRLSAAIQPMRIRFIERVNAMQVDGNTSEKLKEELNTLADNLFKTRIAWLIVLTYPVAVFWAFFPGKTNESQNSQTANSAASTAMGLGIFCAVANSPIALLIFIIELALLLMLFIPLGKVSRAMLDVLFSSTSVLIGNQHGRLKA